MRRFLPFLALLLACLPPSRCPAAAFKLSDAPVPNDPTLTHRPTAKLWPHINIAEARKLIGHDGVVFVDGRLAEEYARSHLPGAISIPAADFDNTYPEYRHRLVHAKVVVVYCHGFSCGIGDAICQMLADQGQRNMCVFSGGFPQWSEYGYPLEGKGVPKRGGRRLNP